ncbi:MAG: DNA-directed RNA polymerase subunit beta', partial [Patescibacteria group bacterium]
LTAEARAEARELMLATKNLLKPAHGGPVATPGKDIAWGIFYLTMVLQDEPKEKTGLPIFSNENDALYAVTTEKLKLRDWIVARLKSGEIVITTPGRIIVNMQFPKEVPFMNQTMGKKEL